MTTLASIAGFLTNMVKTDNSGMTLRQAAALVHIAEKTHPVDFGAVADSLSISRPAMTRAANALEGAGLIARRENEDDRRRVLLNVTDKGRAAVTNAAR